MTQNPPAGTQRIVPYLHYADGARALEFLHDAFGFEERLRVPREDGSIMHAEAGFQDNVVMLGTPVDAAGRAVAGGGTNHSSVMCYVDDVDAHYARAQAAGARIERELVDQPYGDRTYSAVDPEGYTWHFATHVRDVDPSEMAS